MGFYLTCYALLVQRQFTCAAAGLVGQARRRYPRRFHSAAPPTLPRDHLAVVAADRRIHVIGGRLGSPVQRNGQHDVYDHAAGQWSSAAPLPTPRSGVAGVLYAGLILVLGGELPPDHTFPENEGYDPKADRWRPPLVPICW